jgi:hypothetical protein
MSCCAPETVLAGGLAMIGKGLGEWAWRDGVRLKTSSNPANQSKAL